MKPLGKVKGPPAISTVGRWGSTGHLAVPDGAIHHGLTGPSTMTRPGGLRVGGPLQASNRKCEHGTTDGVHRTHTAQAARRARSGVGRTLSVSPRAVNRASL